jgi:hypothetical protein
MLDKILLVSLRDSTFLEGEVDHQQEEVEIEVVEDSLVVETGVVEVEEGTEVVEVEEGTGVVEDSLVVDHPEAVVIEVVEVREAEVEAHAEEEAAVAVDERPNNFNSDLCFKNY